MDIIKKTYYDIKSMRVRGALKIATTAAKAMQTFIENSKEKNISRLISKIKISASILKKSRPTAVSLPNAMNFILYSAEEHKNLEISKFKKIMSSEIQKFIQNQENALDSIARIGSRLINKEDTVLTHCNSETAIEIIKAAWDRTKNIDVVCTETRPRFQGYLSAKEFRAHGIPTTLIIDSAAHYIMKKLEVDKVIVGADAVCVNGDVINKIGTSQIAVCADEMDIDFIVAAESIKFSPESIVGKISSIEERDTTEITKLRGIKILNPAFDITEAKYVDMIITEDGIIPPQAAYNILKEKFGWTLK